MDQINKVEISIPQLIKKMKRISFPFHLKCLNFKANKGSSDTKSRDIMTMIGIKTIG